MIRIDEMVEHDMQLTGTCVKNICLVTKPNEEIVVFNISPYTDADSIIDMAKVWIACDCPEKKDQFGIRQKWNADSLATLATDKENENE